MRRTLSFCGVLIALAACHTSDATGSRGVPPAVFTDSLLHLKLCLPVMPPESWRNACTLRSPHATPAVPTTHP
jgi:hypothetical protein